MNNHKKVLHLVPLKEDEIYVNLKKVNIFTRLIKSINYLIWGDV